MSHWKIGIKILCVVLKRGSIFYGSLKNSWEGQNSMKAKIWGSKFYFFLVEPLVKILCSLKRGVKILYFFPVPWKRGVKTAEPTNQLHWRGAPPGNWPIVLKQFHHTRIFPLQWRHNEHEGVLRHQHHDCLLNRLFRRRSTWSKKLSKLRVTGFVRGIHRWPVNSPHKGPVIRKMFPFDDVIMPCNLVIRSTPNLLPLTISLYSTIIP